MKTKLFSGLLAVIAVSAMVFTGCDLFESETGGGNTASYEPYIITATSDEGDDVRIVITTTRKPRVVLTPMDGDSYVLYVNGVETSRGTIEVNNTVIEFYPSNGRPSVASYTIGETVITLYEGAGGGGGGGTPPGTDPGTSPGVVYPGGGGPGNPTSPPAGKTAAQALADMINLIQTGGATFSGNTVTLTADIVLDDSIEIPANVTLIVPSTIKLTVNGGPPGTPAPDGSAHGQSHQIKGAGTLEVEGTLEARNRVVTARTIIKAGATYSIALENNQNTYNPATAFIGSSGRLTITTGSIEIVHTGIFNNASSSAYTFTLAAGSIANIRQQFPMGAPPDINDKAVIGTGAELTIGTGGSVVGNGLITNNGTIIVANGVNGLSINSALPGANITGPGIIEVRSGAWLSMDESDITGTVVLNSGATLKSKDGNTTVIGSTSPVTLDTNAKLSITKSGTGDSVVYPRTITGGTAKVTGELKLTADVPYYIKDNGVLEFINGGKITSTDPNAKIEVGQYGKIIFVQTAPPTGKGKVVVTQGGKLEIATPAGNWLIIGPNSETYLYEVGVNASIEMTAWSPDPNPSNLNLFKYTFKDGVISTRPQITGGFNNVWVQVPHTISDSATLLIPQGSRVVVVGVGGYAMTTTTEANADPPQIPLGSITVTGTGRIEVAGKLAVDGTGANIQVPALSAITGIANVGYLNYTGGLIGVAEITNGENNWENDNGTPYTLKGKAKSP